MRRLLAPLVLALVATPLAAQELAGQDSTPPKPPPPKVDFSRLKFMAGCWAGKIDPETVVEEIWTTPADNLLLATTRYLKDKRASGFEFTRIQPTDSGVVFAAASDGKPENVYLLKQLADEFVVFENMAQRFPQRIIYRLASDGALIPRNEGDGPSVELRMQKVKCPGT